LKATRIYPAVVMACTLALLTGCQQGTTRPGDSSDSSMVDMHDSTGQFGQTSRTGAGDVYVKLAIAYMQEGKLDIALQKAKTAIKVEPANAGGHNMLGLLYERLSEYGLAEHHFKQSLRHDPQNSYVLNAYGTFLCNQSRYDEADKQFNAALANPLYATPAVALTNAGICASRRPDLSGAERYFRRALEHDPKMPAALIRMAQVSFDNNEHLSARAYLQRYQGVARHTAASLWLGIRTERVLGDQNAVASYVLLLKNNFPDSREIQLLRESENR
jgi:type IV pilus assembly protein PilF